MSAILFAMTVAHLTGCRIAEEQSGPTAQGVVAPGSVTLTYICGNTFRVRNSNTAPVTVTWDVYQKNETGTLILPPKPASAPYSETWFTTVNKGTVRLFESGTLIQTKANGNKPPCATPADTARPTLPDNLDFPDDSATLTRSPSSEYVYYRSLSQVVFRSTASGVQVRSFLSRYNAVIVGGIPISQTYVIRHPAFGPTWADLVSHLEALEADSAVQLALPLPRSGGRRLTNWRLPNDDPNLRASAYVGQADTAWAMRAVRAPQAWGCETGFYGGPLIRVGVMEWAFEENPDLARSAVAPLASVGRGNAPQPSAAELEALQFHGAVCGWSPDG